MNSGSAFGKAAAALSSLVVAVEVGDMTWSAVDIWVLGNTDPKWGSALHNFEFAMDLLQVLVAGSVASFVLVAVLCRNQLRRMSTGSAVLAGTLSGLGIVVAYNLSLITATGRLLPSFTVISVAFMALVPTALISTIAVFVVAHSKAADRGVA